MIRDPDLDGPSLPVKRGFVVHDWRRLQVRSPLDDPAVKARLKAAIALRQAELERDMKLSPARRKALNRRRAEKRAQAFGQIFNWRLDVDWFAIPALSANKTIPGVVEWSGAGPWSSSWISSTAG
jgi:hypothetical protein